MTRKSVGTCRGMSAHQALHLRLLLKADMLRHVPTGYGISIDAAHPCRHGRDAPSTLVSVTFAEISITSTTAYCLLRGFLLEHEFLSKTAFAVHCLDYI